MEGALPVILIAAALGLFLIVVAIVFRALFWGERDMAEQTETAQTWRPPFITGEPLRNWAAVATKRAIVSRLSGQRTGRNMSRLAVELKDEALHAMLPLAGSADHERVVPCPECGQGTIGVTALEAFAIAADLRQKRSNGELRKIFALAVTNSEKNPALPRDSAASLPIRCPLQGDDRVCCAYAARPLHCLPLHAQTVAHGINGTGNGSIGSLQVNPADENRHESDVTQGIRAGLCDALRTAGMDSRIYELNRALAIALARPDAAERWANGDDVFMGCPTIAALPARAAGSDVPIAAAGRESVKSS